MRPRSVDVLVVGAGFAGTVMAERAAAAGLRVLVIDRREHIAGNAFDEYDRHGVQVHRYGPHIFHTNAPKVSDYLSRFTAWRPYEHRVRALVGSHLVPLPINRETVNTLHGRDLRGGADVAAHLHQLAEPQTRIESSEDVVVSQVGRDLYEQLFRGYTHKQWGIDASQLDAAICARIPVRFDDEDRYFSDTFQQMPTDGYTAMFERLLAHPLITVATGTDFAAVADVVCYDMLVWTGPIDAYFGYRSGELPYRSVRLEFRTEPTAPGELLQPVGVVNYPNEAVPYTRTAEYRHLTGQRLAHATGQPLRWSTISYEFPTADGEPCYPIPCPESRALYRRYAQLAQAERGVVFVGRLARYQYLNMDQVVAQALHMAVQAFGSRALVHAAAD